MNRVFIVVALATTMLFGSTAFAGGKSVGVQLNTNFVSVHWNQYGHQHKRPQWKKRRAQHSQRFGRYHAHKHIQRSAPGRYGKRRNHKIVRKIIRHFLGHQAHRHYRGHRGWRH